MLELAQGGLPRELPVERARRFEHELGLNPDRARELAFRAELADYFERALAASGDGAVVAVEVANWIPLLVARIGSDTDPRSTKVTPESLAELATMVSAREVSRDAAREVLDVLVQDGGRPGEIVKARGLGAITAGLEEIIDRAIASDPAAADQVRAGNAKALGPLVGFVMRETKGRADGGEVRRLLLERVRGG
jgi:aspartyl-tRNA(Asn)/glutamyl-tRNA(Gln) amidotransferase subunit B